MFNIQRTNKQRIAWSNTSSRIPDKEIRAMLRFLAQHVDLDGVIIEFKDKPSTQRRAGCAHNRVPLRIRGRELGGYTWRYYIMCTDYQWRVTLAHEAKHIEQFREKLKLSDKRAEHWAWWITDQFEFARLAA